jgi:hypothetical protein
MRPPFGQLSPLASIWLRAEERSVTNHVVTSGDNRKTSSFFSASSLSLSLSTYIGKVVTLRCFTPTVAKRHHANGDTRPLPAHPDLGRAHEGKSLTAPGSASVQHTEAHRETRVANCFCMTYRREILTVPALALKKGDAKCRPEGGLSPQTGRMVARTRKLAANLKVGSSYWKG